VTPCSSRHLRKAEVCDDELELEPDDLEELLELHPATASIPVSATVPKMAARRARPPGWL
jgi:hypothetical protein